jgi:carboxymethylenebutenolidase
MKVRLGLLVAALAVILIGLYIGMPRTPGRIATVHSTLPSEAGAKTVLNATYRHRQWVNVEAGSSSIRAFIVYPQRSNKAPVVVLSATGQGASDWIRAVADQVAAEGFIAIVPDVLSGLGPNGGDANDFPSATAVADALERLGPREIARRTEAVRQYAIALPSATGQSASLNFDSIGRTATVAVGKHTASFSGNAEIWPRAIAYLTKETGDRPVGGVNPDVPEDHSAHIGMAMAQGRGFPKVPNLPASGFNAKGTLASSKLRKEFVDISMDHVKLHTWVEYPEGDGKAPIVIVMQHAPGMDEWQRALADQLALEGFIAIAPDLNSGLGPNGGNFDSFVDADSVSRAIARLNENDILERYKAARNWGMKLARANGKSASIGFCMGGGNSFRLAAEVPELNAAVSYYGNPSKSLDFSKVHAPVLAFYGEEDARVTSTLPATQAAMKENGKSFEAHNYPHTTHGFVEYQTLAGNLEALTDAWPKTIAFLKKHTQ